MYPDIRAVLVVSPTYDGIVSDIHRIAKIVHRAGLPLIGRGPRGPLRYADESGIRPPAGADLVIQSVHKTPPSLTQTAASCGPRRGRRPRGFGAPGAIFTDLPEQQPLLCVHGFH